jgi:hypothetical protein
MSTPPTPDTVRQYIEAWGAMGALCGIHRSVARVHALLLAHGAELGREWASELKRHYR